MAQPARVNRIAYINLQGQLETVDPFGEDHRVLTGVVRAERFYQFPVWAPDSGHIAVIGANRLGSGVYVFRDAASDAESGGTQLFSSRTDVPIYAYWAPDCRHISFIAITPPQQSFGLHVVSIDGSHTDRTVIVGRPCFWQWLDDSERILLHTGFAGDENSQLQFLNPFAPPEPHSFDNIADPGLFQTPAVAPNGEYWAFAQINAAGEPQIVVDGRGLSERMTVPHHGLVAMGWSPSGNELAYISPPAPARTTYGPLRVLDVDGELTELTDDMVVAFFWSPDGRSIAYFTLADVFERLADANPAAFNLPGDVLVDPGGFVKEPESSGHERVLRLNLFVVDVESGERRLLYTFQPLEVFVNQFLPFFDQYSRSHTIWSPDSNAITLSVMKGDEARVMVIPVDDYDAPPRMVAAGLMAFWSQT